MTQALLLIGHGSREAEGNAQFVDLVGQVKAAAGPRLVEHCFIELAEPGIPAGIEACVRRGAERVIVLPVILFSAAHSKVEIPEYLDAARKQYPGVSFDYGRTFGIDPFVLSMLGDRLAAVEAAYGPFERSETAVIVVGRGSSDADANSDLAKVARLLFEQERVAVTEICYSGVTHPDLPTVMRRVARLGYRRVVVLPYFLFTGVLIRRIRDWVEQCRAEHPAVEIHLGEQFGGHPNLVKILSAREQGVTAGGPQT
jgi:sirohydrochlorin cobaltochelatase